MAVLNNPWKALAAMDSWPTRTDEPGVLLAGTICHVSKDCELKCSRCTRSACIDDEIAVALAEDVAVDG